MDKQMESERCIPQCWISVSNNEIPGLDICGI